MRGIIEITYGWLEWVTKLAYLNALWLGMSALGLVVFGIFPATSAVFAVVRKWQFKDEVPVWNTFWATYRQDFVRASAVGYPLLIVGWLIRRDLVFSHGTAAGILSHVLEVLFLIVLAYIGPVTAHYDVSPSAHVRFAFLIGITHPVKTILIMLELLSFLYVMSHFFRFMPFFSMSLLALLLTQVAHWAFPKAGSESTNRNRTHEGDPAEYGGQSAI